MIKFLLFIFFFQVDVWALGVSAIEMAEVYTFIITSRIHSKSLIVFQVAWFLIAATYDCSFPS